MVKVLILFSLIILSSCTCNSPKQSIGLHTIQGVWVQKISPYDNKLVNTQSRRITFKCDSFYILIKNRSTIIISTDSCYNKKNWEEFVKGVYKFNNDTVFLKGTYVNKYYKLKTNNCFNNGNFEEIFLISNISKDSLRINSFSKGNLQFGKVKSINCK